MNELNGPISPPQAPLASAISVGEWLVEPARNRISSEGDSRKLEPRVMRLLATLATAPGRPFSRHALLDAVWPDVTVNEEALSRAVSQLRRALGDDSRNPVYIETVHRGGYCLIAPVRSADEALRGERPQTELAHRRSLPSFGALAAIISLLGFALAAAYALFLLPPTARHEDAPKQLLPIPLTSEPGREIDPAISPDGSRLAYVASTESGYDLFWRQIGEGRSVRLTRDSRLEGHPVWSPSGQHLAYISSDADGENPSISVVTVATGASEKILDLPAWSFGLDWSRDGRTLAYSGRDSGAAAQIVLLDLATRGSRRIPRAPSDGDDVKPVFAPDGNRIAFLRDVGMDQQRIVVASLSGSPAPAMLVGSPEQLRGLDWDERGTGLIYSAKSGGRFGLWWLPATGGGAPAALAAAGAELFNPSVSADGKLVAEAVERDSDIWRAPVGGEQGAVLIQSTFDDYDPAFSPAGRRIAFVSERSGAPELWWAEVSGNGATQITAIAGADIGRPAWSSDGQRIAFYVRRSGYAATHIAAVGQRASSQVLGGNDIHHVPIGWGAAADELLVLSGTSRAWWVERMDLRSRKRSRLSNVAVRLAGVSADGRSVFAIDARGTRLMRLFLGSRPAELVPLPSALRGAVAVHEAGGALLFVTPTPGGAAVARWIPAGPVEPLGEVPASGPLAISPDGMWLLYGRDRETSNDIVLFDLGS